MSGERSVLAVAMVMPTAAALLYFVILGGNGEGGQPNLFMQAAYAATKVIQFSLPVLWLAVADRAALRMGRGSFRGLPTGLAFGVAVATLAIGLYAGWLANSPLFVGVAERVRAKMAAVGAATPARYVALAAFLSVAHSLLEEYYWRWFVYGRLRRHVRPAVALSLSGVAFMAHHVVILGVFFPGWFWPAVVPFSLAIAIGGIVWSWLYERTGSLAGPWVSHLVVDAGLMWIGYDLVFGRT